jgi:excisionase family DNA binding protein
MTLYTIQEAAQFLRMSKRTLYHRKDIPRIREGRRILFLKEDIEAWVLAHREVAGIPFSVSSNASKPSKGIVDPPGRTVYHRSPALRSKVVR